MYTLTERVSAEKVMKASNMLKVIAHPVRLAMVDLLREGNRMSVLEIQEALELDQPIASQHLALLQERGVVASEKIGRNRYFYLHYPELMQIVSCLENCCEKF